MSETDYQRGLLAAADLMDAMTREWLADAETCKEDDQLGYPPFHFMQARERLLKLAAVPSMTERTR